MDNSPHSLDSRQEWYRTAVRSLDGKLVMVNPGGSREKPAVGMRGTLRVTPALDVEIVLQFAVMFARPAENKVIRLDEAQVASLLASENNGAYSITLPGEIDAPPSTGFVVASPKL
jgi:hypothetical protein